MGHSKSTKRLPIEKVSFDRAGSSRMHPTHNVFFEELLAIEILAQRPDKMDRWGVPQGAARPSTNPVLLGKAKEAPATRFRAAASGKGVLDMLHTTTPSREGGGGCGRGQRNLTLITPAAQSAPRPQSVFHPSWLLPRCRPSIFGFVFVHRAIKIHSRVCQQRIPVDNTGGRPNHACEWFSVTIWP